MTTGHADTAARLAGQATNTTSPWLHAALACGIVFTAAFVGSTATMPSIPTWYAGIAKPSFNPPNWVFGPAWTLLFTMMTVAFWRILRKPAGTPGRRQALAIFGVQLVLNALWSIVFFGMQNPPLALIVVFALEAAIIATIVSFWKLDRPAAWLLGLYPLWVGFATVLNIAIVWLNR